MQRQRSGGNRPRGKNAVRSRKRRAGSAVNNSYFLTDGESIDHRAT